MTSRSCPIRFHYDGNPSQRPVANSDLIKYVRTHRLEILGELAGMVVWWAQRGRQHGAQVHRMGEWAGTIGGIVAANGLSGFLENVDAAHAEFDSGADQMAVLVEKAVAMRQQYPSFVRVVSPATAAEPAPTIGCRANELAPLFRATSVLQEKLGDGRSTRQRGMAIGRFLDPLIGRPIPFEMPPEYGATCGAAGVATLRMQEGRSRTKRYHLEIVITPPDDATPDTAGEGGPTGNPPPTPLQASPPTPFAPATERPWTLLPTGGNGEEW